MLRSNWFVEAGDESGETDREVDTVESGDGVYYSRRKNKKKLVGRGEEIKIIKK